MYFLMRIVSVGTLSSAAVLALVPAQARELAPVDALGNAPLAIQRKAVALSANVQSLSREERLGLPTFVQLRPPPPWPSPEPWPVTRSMWHAPNSRR